LCHPRPERRRAAARSSFIEERHNIALLVSVPVGGVLLGGGVLGLLLLANAALFLPFLRVWLILACVATPTLADIVAGRMLGPRAIPAPH